MRSRPPVPILLLLGAGAIFGYSGWGGKLTGSENPTNITMDDNKTATATFSEVDYNDVIFDSNFDMGNLINVIFVSGDGNGNRFYKGEQNHTTASGMTGKHWWFYFSMDNIAGKNVTITIWKNEAVDFSTDPVNGNRWPNIEPVYSYDNVNWERLPLANVQYDRTALTYTMTVTAGTQNKIYLAPIPPYTISKRDALFAEFASNPYLTVASLGTTPDGQELKVATITDPVYNDSNKFKSYVTAQQHSGEIPASWNAEGMIRFLLSDDPTAQAIRRSHIFKIIPIVNVDGVYYGRSRYTPLRGGIQYDLNREWNKDVGSMQPEARWIFHDMQAWHPDCFNDLHSTINTEQVSPKEALTYTWSLTNTTIVTFMNKIRDGGWPQTVRAVSSLAGGAFQNVHSRLNLDEAISFENPHNELSTAPGVKLTVNDWMNWGKGYAKGVYLYFGDAHASLTVSTDGNGSVTKNPDNATYPYGTSVQLTATADPGYTFSHWSGDLSGSVNPATVVVTGNKSVTAVFVIPLPIELASFTGNLIARNRVQLEWRTVSEVNNYGFFIERRGENEQSYRELPNSFIPGHGTTLAPQRYSYTDEGVGAGRWYYRLRQVDLDGSVRYSEAIRIETWTRDDGENVPTAYILKQNHPNPFNPSTTIEFALPCTEFATLKLFNLLGQEIQTLVGERLSAGRYEVEWKARGCSSGMYFYRLVAGSYVETKKMFLLR